MTARSSLPFDPIAEARRQWEAHGWRRAAPGMALVTSVIRVQQLFLARIDATLRPFDLSFARFELLALLSFTRHGALPLSKAGERLQVHPASITNVVNKLEADGLVRRTPHQRDRRTTLVELLPAGREVLAGAMAALNDEVFSEPGVSPSGARAIFDLLREIRVGAGDFEEGGSRLP